MDRPMYETPENKQNELRVLGEITKKWMCGGHKLPIKYGLDYSLTRSNEILGFCEIKCRNYPFSHFLDGYQISLNKIMAAKNLYETTSIPCFLVIDCKDGIWYTQITEFKNIKPVLGGRKDRGDWQDFEPMAVIDAGKFKKIVSK